MIDRAYGRQKPSRATPHPASARPKFKEPVVRRWSHNIDELPSPPEQEAALHYLRCSLSYQNQLLADIKALLERLNEPEELPQEDSSPE